MHESSGDPLVICMSRMRQRAGNCGAHQQRTRTRDGSRAGMLKVKRGKPPGRESSVVWLGFPFRRWT
jgi:hypothetical protein